MRRWRALSCVVIGMASMGCLGLPEETRSGIGEDGGLSSEMSDSGAEEATDAHVSVDAGSQDGGTTGSAARDLFLATVAPILGGANGTTGACGACHAIAGGIGPAFMLPNPDMLTTLLAYPGIIGATPEKSRLYAKGAHLGPAFTDEQAPIVATWIVRWNAENPSAAEDAGIPGEDKPRVAPFAPVMGENTIDLGVLGPTLAGAKVTFQASMVGTAQQSLRLRDIRVSAPANVGLHAVHPLWVVWGGEEQEPKPDPVDSFAATDMKVNAGMSSTMEPGIVLLPGFSGGAKLSLVFVTLEPMTDTNMPMSGCKNVASFSANARPALSANCARCHAGNDASATLAYSLRGVNDNAPEMQARACASTLGVVDLQNPANSRMYQEADPGSGAPHPFKLNANDLNAFRQAADVWINSEK